MKKLFTTTEAARKFGVCRQRIDQWIAEGRIEVVARVANGVRLIDSATLKRPKKRKAGRPRIMRARKGP